MTESILLRIDILGYTGMMGSLDAGIVVEKIEEIIRVYFDKVRWMPEEMKPKLKIHKMYGDTLDIHYERGEGDAAIMMLLEIASNIICDFVKEKMLVRGAIVIGDIRDSDYAFTGKAMATAHIEEKACCFPSVIIDKDVVSIIVDQIRLLYGINSSGKESEYIFEYGGKCYLDCIRGNKDVLSKMRDVVCEYRERAESPEDTEKCSAFMDSLKHYSSKSSE